MPAIAHHVPRSKTNTASEVPLRRRESSMRGCDGGLWTSGAKLADDSSRIAGASVGRGIDRHPLTCALVFDKFTV